MSDTPRIIRKRKPLTQLPVDETVVAPKRSRTTDSNQIVPTCPRRAGTVNYMILKNFMCHSMMEVDFQQNNISMVIGKNGSGKSAILTALIVGLGGRANLTNRGSSVKGFVKVGKQSGSVEIQLCNEGPMAYKPTKYGKTITVIKNFNASGGGTYRIKSANGQVISTQAKEVANITSNFNIQVDNPVCLLTQDTSRNFLSSTDPHKKFALFMKATILESLETEYNTILTNKNDSVRILAEKKKNLTLLQEEVRRLKIKIDSHQSIVTLKERKLALQSEIVWAQVRDVEEELAGEQKKMDKLVKKLEDFEANSRSKEKEIEEIQEIIRGYERQAAELKEQLEIRKGPQNDLKGQLDELKKAYNVTKAKKQGIAIEIDGKVKDMEHLQQEINNANENMSKVEQQKKEKMANLSKLQEKLKGTDDHLETARNELFQMKNEIGRKYEDERNLNTEIGQIDQKIAQEEAIIQACRRESGNSLILYGRNIPRVKELISQSKHKFQHEPKGPLGSYMKLKDKKWAVAAEGFLGRGMLGAFTVDNQKDGKMLQQIFAKCFVGQNQPVIITSKFLDTKHDVSKNMVQAPSDCISLNDAVIIEDPVVFNCIVDQMSTESILLIPNDERARELMSDRNCVPKNCRQALTIKGDKYYPDPHYKTYASTYHKAHYLQTDTREHMQFLQENISNLRDRKRAILSQLEALQKDAHIKRLRQRELEDKIRKITSAKQQIRKQYDDLSNQAVPEVHDLNILENELQEIKRILIEKNATLGQTEEEIREIKTKIAAHSEQMLKMRDATRELEDRLWPLQEQIKESESKQRQISANDQLDKRRLDEFRKRVKDASAAVALKQSEVNSKFSNASKLGERPSELRCVPDISKEVQEISRSIARLETETEDIAEVSERYSELLEKYNLVAETMKSLYKNIDELSFAMDRRKKHYKLTEKYFVTLIKHSFKKILEIRQFEGMVEINMEEKKLDLIVIPQQGSQGLTTASNLSGGERSFSTVAFLYSLWQCTDFPFYFLDEFDVYMDKLNRTKVINILLHHADSKPDLQFVFLTPQDVSFIDQHVSILRLADPERISQ